MKACIISHREQCIRVGSWDTGGPERTLILPFMKVCFRIYAITHNEYTDHMSAKQTNVNVL